MSSLRFVLGDQLTPNLSALRGAASDDVVLMAEVADETTYVPHHRKKIVFVLAAMRAFADELRGLGFMVDYVKLDDPGNTGSLSGELQRAVARHRPTRIAATLAGEHRVVALQRSWAGDTGLTVDLFEDDRFICSRADFERWAADRKQLRMEYFYREMRRRTDLLMDGDQPEGGRWNFDADNRKPASRDLFMRRPPAFAPSADTQSVINLVALRFPHGFGALDGFAYPVTRAEGEQARDAFLAEALPRFGDYQDAMLADEPFLYHSILSPCLNVGLLDPLDLCRRAELEYRAGRAPLNAVEGFIRQIIGWREYVRGIYWREGPDYLKRNALNATHALPSFYWTGETDMRCLSQAIGQTIQHAYAHHIQRLMITGNFALIAGIDPYQVHEWYLAVYVDAYEWVEAPNTIGMSLFADGGLLGSKPYAAGGAYINRMSDYCKDCRYRVSEKTGADACPFNYLYWDFVARNATLLLKNPRTSQVARAWSRLDDDRQLEVRESATRFLLQLERDSAPGNAEG
jgi:deoxyribodipyrimidine photolyase-related protein